MSEGVHNPTEPKPMDAISGICFVVLFVGGLVPFGDLLGSFADSDETFDSFFADAGKRTIVLVGGVLLGTSALAFIWFLQHLRQRLHPADARPSTLAHMVYSCGLIFVGLLMVSAAALVTVPFALAFGSVTDDQPFAAARAVLPQFGYVVLALYAMWAAAVAVVAATVLARRSDLFPRWLALLSYIAAGVMVLLGSSVMGILALPVWVLAVSVHWWNNRLLTNEVTAN